MRYLALLLAAAGSLLSCERADAAFTKAFQSGPWEGTAYFRDDNGAVSVCSARTHYENGLSLSIALRPSGSWALLLVRPEGFSNTPTQYTLRADGRFLHSGPGTPESDGQLLRIDIPYSEETIQSLQHGTTLRISSSFGDTAFSLKGSADAIAELRSCVKADGKGAFGSGREKDQSSLGVSTKAAAKNESDALRPVTRDQLIPYAKQILQDAGFADYRFLPQGTNDKSNALVWQFKDGTLGSLAAAEKAGSIDLDRYIGQMTIDDTTSCKGEFAGGKRAPRYVNGAEVRKVFASCNSGLQSFYAEYAFVRMPDGFLVKLTALKSGSSVMFGRGGRETQDDLDKVTRTEESTLAAFSKH
jgi:hypothetical protein